MNEITKYDEMTRAIQVCENIDEVKNLQDRALAMQVYARQANNLEAEQKCAAIRIRAQRRCGELTREIPKDKGGYAENYKDSMLSQNSGEHQTKRQVLNEHDIDNRKASEWERLAAIPDEEFEAELATITEKKVVKASDFLKKQNHQDRVDKINAISEGNVELDQSKTYPVIYADPPWRYDYSKADNRKIENHYPTMELQEICDVPVADIACDDAVLFMWATSPKLAESIRVIEAWGFSYRTSAVWDKGKIGMGYYFRQQHELLLVATRGKIPVPLPETRVSSVFNYLRGKHSAKPHEFYGVIESMYPQFSKIELFCRTPRDGWDVWGNQSDSA